MNLIIDKNLTVPKHTKSVSMVVIGNGPAFLQAIVMLEGRDVIAVTNNDADFLTLERFGVKPLKNDFNSQSLSFIRDNGYKIVLISSTSNSAQITRALHTTLLPNQVLLIVRYPSMRKISKHPYTYYLDTADQFHVNLWHRSTALYRLALMNEYIKSRSLDNQKKVKMLILFFGPPDPDAIASSIALSKLYSKLAVTTFASTAKVKRFENRALVSYLKIIIKDIVDIKIGDYQVIACLDSQPAFFAKSGYDIPFDICIDHHPESPDNPVIPISDIRKNHGSCSTILAQYYFYTKKYLSKNLATAFLFGIRSDTANFTRAVSEPDVNMLTFLHKKVDSELLKKFEFSKVPKRALKYMKRAYTRYYFEGSFLRCHLGNVRYLDIGSIVAEHFLRIQGVYFTVVSCIYRAKLIVFFRSVSNKYHAGESAEALFKGYGVGGGHKDMGRAECDVCDLPYSVKEIEDRFQIFIKGLPK